LIQQRIELRFIHTVSKICKCHAREAKMRFAS
jgi:hypothetical protein